MANLITSDRTRAVYNSLLDIHAGTLAEVAEAVGDKQGRVLGHLRRLRRLGLVQLQGSKRGGMWTIRSDSDPIVFESKSHKESQ